MASTDRKFFGVWLDRTLWERLTAQAAAERRRVPDVVRLSIDDHITRETRAARRRAALKLEIPTDEN